MIKQRETLSYGSWPAVIGSDCLTRGQCRFSEPQFDAGTCFWLESRPWEKGRGVVVGRKANGCTFEVTPTHISVRSRIHEYGGGCYRVHRGVVYFVNDRDQRIYRMRVESSEPALAISPEAPYCYGDFCIDEQRRQLICVCEMHTCSQKTPENCIVAIPLEASSPDQLQVLVSGNDFYSNPRVSPDGRWLSWLTWNHPHMPWDSSECWLAEFDSASTFKNHRKISGGLSPEGHLESIVQPQWSPEGELYFVSDRNSWWNLYRYNTCSGQTRTLTQLEAEFAAPQWQFGLSSYDFIDRFSVFCCYTRDGQWHAAIVDTRTNHFQPLELPYNNLGAVSGDREDRRALFVAASAESADAVVQWQHGALEPLTNRHVVNIHRDDTARAQTINFENARQQVVQGFFYRPQNARYQGPQDTLPPLIVICHGGPTSAIQLSLNLKIQYWTNRGFAVFDVNYSGSSGYGRPYRDRLKGWWGVLDVEDICAGVQYLIDHCYVDPEKVVIRGSSAGGFTALAALVVSDVFKAGTSLYGISDLEVLAKDTHKFEAHYLDSLIGFYPEEKATYQGRSPFYHVNQIEVPVLFLQGGEDRVVLPNQAEIMIDALAQKRVPVAYHCYPQEGHGFRQAETIRHALELEYAFYAHVFGLSPTESLPQVPFVYP